MSYKVKLNIFEGPLDLLLFLIKRERIDIYDIPIAKITQQYLEYLEVMKLLDLDIAGEFLVVAATLMHIKSKMLLPPDEKDDLLEEEEEDPREELVRRLLEYKKYKDAAARLQEMRDEHKNLFMHTGEGERERIITDGGEEYFEASLFDLIGAFNKVLQEVPKKTFHEAVKDKFTVRDKIHTIYHVLAKNPKTYFTSLFKDAKNKDEIIVTFLAILELIKLREIIIVQKEFFGEIEIIRNPELAKK
jgi:segregation and condensation protein A